LIRRETSSLMPCASATVISAATVTCRSIRTLPRTPRARTS
jgi:hypothetical protein